MAAFYIEEGAMLLIDLTHTSHTTAQTGIQRVCRSLYTAIKHCQPTEAITFDPYEQTWRSLARWEHRNLSTQEAAAKRGARWPFTSRVTSTVRRWGGTLRTIPAAGSLIIPEVFSPTVAANLPTLFSRIKGPRIALFHDAIALKYPELSPAKTVMRFPAYLHELLSFDAIAAVSEDSRVSLVEYWRWLGVRDTPLVRTLTLPVVTRPSAVVQLPTSTSKEVVVLCVATIEGRKNHLALLEACEQVWKKQLKFTLHLVGMAHPHTGHAALREVRRLQAIGRSLRYDGPIDDRSLVKAYQESTFTVYPSLIEGFGLPVLESLSYGKPCICSARGALGESAKSGGCVALDRVDSPSLAAAIERLLTDDQHRAELVDAARKRTFKSWADYAREFISWIDEVPPRPSVLAN